MKNILKVINLTRFLCVTVLIFFMLGAKLSGQPDNWDKMFFVGGTVLAILLMFKVVTNDLQETDRLIKRVYGIKDDE